MPAQLSPDAVGDGGDELPAQPQLGAQLQSELLGRVLLLRHVPLELVHQGDVPHVDVQLAGSTDMSRSGPLWGQAAPSPPLLPGTSPPRSWPRPCAATWGKENNPHLSEKG